jgi:hypothetical protein
LKIIQYLSVEIPAVCTPVWVNGDIVKEGYNGFWTNDHQEWEWVDRIAKLIRDPGLGKEWGGRGSKRLKRVCPFHHIQKVSSGPVGLNQEGEMR